MREKQATESTEREGDGQGDLPLGEWETSDQADVEGDDPEEVLGATLTTFDAGQRPVKEYRLTQDQWKTVRIYLGI